jgi:plastocyanin domain-containing protein
VSQTIVPKPSICAPSWILIASPSFSVIAASASSEVSGVYGVTNEDGETVVGCEMPVDYCQSCEAESMRYAPTL